MGAADAHGNEFQSFPEPDLFAGKTTLTYAYNSNDFWGPTLIMNKGDKVQDVTVTPKIAGGTATFKTKPTPIGPLHKASVSITIKFTAVATLEGGTTKRGTVSMTVTSKGARLGIPGGD